MTEVCKCLNRLSPDVLNEVLTVSKHRYNSQHYNLFVTNRPKTDMCGRKSIPYRATQIWNLLPCEKKLQNTWILLNYKLSNDVR